MLKYCKFCNTPLDKFHGKRSICFTCRPKFDRYSATLANTRKSQVNKDAREVFATLRLPRKCQHCGYDKHIEVCHIKAIKDFPKSTPLTIVNASSNLLGLCPNCHYLFDSRDKDLNKNLYA